MGQRQSSKGRSDAVTSENTLSSQIAASPTSIDGGRKFDPEFEGPVKKRSCTDVICCILFLICILLLACVAGWSFLMGDYRRIVFPKDSRGRICGLDYPEKGSLFFFDMLSCLDIGDLVLEYGCPTEQVCVSRCPNYTWTAAEGDTFESRSKMICQGGVSGNHDPYKKKSIQSLVQEGLCAPKISPTNTVFWRCVPSGLLPAIDNRTRESMKYPKSVKPPPSYPSIVLGARTIVTKMLEDLIRTWKVILVCIILAAFISFLWILLMRLCTRAMVYFTLLIFVGIFGAATGFCFWRYVETKKLSADPPPFYFTIDITVYFRYATTWLALGIISAIILLLVLAIIIFLRKRIALAHFVIGETSKAIADLPITLLWPIFPFILIVGVIVLWFFVDMNLRSIAVSEGVLFSNSAPEPKAKFSNEWVRWALSGASKCDPTANTTSGGICHFVRQIGQAYIPWLQVYNFAMCLWLVNYVIALDQATLAGAFASFYFSDHHRRHGSSGQRRRQWGCCGAALLLSTFSTALFYHTGSLALGSLLITLFSLIRMILLRLQRKLKLAENPVAKFFLRCMCCCFWCLEKFLRFLNKNAYIIMAIYGHGFCRSARDAFGLILRNVVRVFVVEKTTDFILFVGKITVCAFSSCVAYAYMSGRVSNFLLINSEQGLHLNYMIIPILVIALASYLVAKAFFTVYEIGADTIFVCVCEDLERNDGTPEKPYFMGQSMMRTLKKPDPDTTN